MVRIGLRDGTGVHVEKPAREGVHEAPVACGRVHDVHCALLRGVPHMMCVGAEMALCQTR